MKRLLILTTIASLLLASCTVLRDCPTNDKHFFLRKEGQKIPLKKVRKP